MKRHRKLLQSPDSGSPTRGSGDRIDQIANLLSDLGDLMHQENFGKETMHHLRQLQMRVRFAKQGAVPKSTIKALPERASKFWIDREDKGETPVSFIAREYARWLGKGLTRAHIRKLDIGLYDALKHWLRGNALPADFDLPTKSEMIDRRLASAESLSVVHSPEQKEKLRLREAARRRAMKR